MKDTFSFISRRWRLFITLLSYILIFSEIVSGQTRSPNEIRNSNSRGADLDVDLSLYPTVPEGFEITLVATEPLVRNPGAIAFDGRGRMFIGQGPQYRRMKPDSPKDSVYLLLDEDGDGVADGRKLYATGFNCVQGLVWRGDDLYVANAPDLTLVRDLDGDDVADEYTKLYTDLGNLEHGLHGLSFAPDGRIYMSKGNSKGLNKPDRVAPKPFRDLWGIKAPDGSPDFPKPETYTADNYKATFHDPEDDWGRMGGVLRAEPDGSELEIYSRGQRNSWDINYSDTFDWFGGDNDQVEGDRFFSPFSGSHHGWNHAWSNSWTGEGNLATAPAMNSLVDGSLTGVVYYDAQGFPDRYKGYFVGDWLRKVVYLIRPEWDGAQMKMKRGKPLDFVKGGKSLLRTTDIEIGPDGSLYILSWGTTYGAVFKEGEMLNEGRVWRVSWKGDSGGGTQSNSVLPVGHRSIEELIEDLDHNLKSRRVNVASELVRRGAVEELRGWLSKGRFSTVQETWGLWTLGRMAIEDESLDRWFAEFVDEGSNASLNRRLQSIRILGFRASSSNRFIEVSENVGLDDPEPRCRQAAAIAIMEAADTTKTKVLISVLAKENDRMVFYSGWQALRKLLTTEKLTILLSDARSKIRLASLLALLESRSIEPDEVVPLLDDPDSEVSTIARSYLEKAGVIKPEKAEDESDWFTGLPLGSFVRNVEAVSGRHYIISSETIGFGVSLYADDGVILTEFDDSFEGLSFILGHNQDAGSTSDEFLTFDLPTASTVYIAHDVEMADSRPDWLTKNFRQVKGKRLRSTARSYVLFEKDFPSGRAVVGGNTVDGYAGTPINYIVMIKPLGLEPPKLLTTTDNVKSLLGRGSEERGEWLFFGRQGAACWSCHEINGRGNAYGPDLSKIGERDNVPHWIESILEPNVIVTEGYATQSVTTKDGQAYMGVLVEESGLAVILRQVSGEVVQIPKSKIAERTSLHSSLMPSFASSLRPQDIADILIYLSSQTSKDEPTVGFEYSMTERELSISYQGNPIAQYTMEDPRIPRPYFHKIQTLDGIQVTRNHPPIEGQDATDHDTFHPGLWMAYGDISGNDYWRNRATVKHHRFVEPPQLNGNDLVFSVENILYSEDGEKIGRQLSRFVFEKKEKGILIEWEDSYTPEMDKIVFGDQEEMGLGIRMATPLTELATGLIRTSTGLETAKVAWGKAAAWSDYSGISEGRHVGITIMADPNNFRPTWWHSRNYGVMATNSFGRRAMKQGEVSSVEVNKGETLMLRYGVYIHSGEDRISKDKIDAVFDSFSRKGSK